MAWNPVNGDSLAGALCPQYQTPVDVLGDHAVCFMHNQIGQRHVALQDSLMSLVQSVGITCKRELGPSGTRQRPGDLLIPRWDCNGPAAIDLTIRHHQAPSGPWRDEKNLTKWQGKQEEQKCTLYVDQCARQGWQFFPFLMDTWGAIAPEGQKVMQGLLKVALSDSLGWRRRQKEANMWHTLTILPMKKIARQVRIHGRIGDELVASATRSSHVHYL